MKWSVKIERVETYRGIVDASTEEDAKVEVYKAYNHELLKLMEINLTAPEVKEIPQE